MNWHGSLIVVGWFALVGLIFAGCAEGGVNSHSAERPSWRWTVIMFWLCCVCFALAALINP